MAEVLSKPLTPCDGRRASKRGNELAPHATVQKMGSGVSTHHSLCHDVTDVFASQIEQLVGFCCLFQFSRVDLWWAVAWGRHSVDNISMELHSRRHDLRRPNLSGKRGERLLTRDVSEVLRIGALTSR